MPDISNVYLCKCPNEAVDKKRKKKVAKKRPKKSNRVIVKRSRHEYCNNDDGLVPGNMGWLWTTAHHQIADKGRKPGVIDDNVLKNMRLPKREVIRRDKLQYLQHVNTIRKSFCRVNVDPDAFKNDKSPLKVDCRDDKVQIVVNPPKDVNVKNSKTGVDMNEPMVLNITRKLQQKSVVDKINSDCAPMPITHIVQKPKNKPSQPEFEELLNIEYIPPTSWLKTNSAINSKTTGTQCSNKPCYNPGTSNTNVLQSRLKSTSKINMNDSGKSFNTKMQNSKLSSDTCISTFGSRTKIMSNTPSRLGPSRTSTHNSLHKLIDRKF